MKTLATAKDAQQRATANLDWRKRMSDNVAYALLTYTGLQIFVTMAAIKGLGGHSLLPYFSLVILVAAIIPGCRAFEARWAALSDEEASNRDLAGAFAKDRCILWICAIGLPLALTALFKAVATFL